MKPTIPGQTRQPRNFFTDTLTSGTAFLTGFKLGSVLAKKGFDLGHGQIASSHSFQLFGKTFNKAMSLSYGDKIHLMPVLSEPVNDEETNENFSNKNIYHVTVIESPTSQKQKEIQAIVSETTNDKPEDNEVGETSKVEGKSIQMKLYQDERLTENNFLKEHNKRVNEFNKGLLQRVNSKF